MTPIITTTLPTTATLLPTVTASTTPAAATPTVTIPVATSPDACTNAAAFVANVTIPDNSQIAPSIPQLGELNAP